RGRAAPARVTRGDLLLASFAARRRIAHRIGEVVLLLARPRGSGSGAALDARNGRRSSQDYGSFARGQRVYCRTGAFRRPSARALTSATLAVLSARRHLDGSTRRRRVFARVQRKALFLETAGVLAM